MLRKVLILSLAIMVVAIGSIFAASEVAIYTGETQWISKAVADEQADIYTNLLKDAGITNTWFKSKDDGAKILEL